MIFSALPVSKRLTPVNPDDIPYNSITNCRELVTTGKDMEALTLMESYLSCYPYMSHTSLVVLLATAVEHLRLRNEVLLDKSVKKIIVLKADTKADPEVVEAAEAKRDAAQRTCIKTNIKAYKMRQLREIYVKADAVGEAPGQKTPKPELPGGGQ